MQVCNSAEKSEREISSMYVVAKALLFLQLFLECYLTHPLRFLFFK